MCHKSAGTKVPKFLVGYIGSLTKYMNLGSPTWMSLTDKNMNKKNGKLYR